MTEHKICEGCRWNNYPTCSGTIMPDGNEMSIENLKPGFQCDKKNEDNITDFSIIKKSDLELKIDDLQNQIDILKLQK